MSNDVEALCDESIAHSPAESGVSCGTSNISSLLEVLQCEDEEILVKTLRELQKVASGVVVLAWNHSFSNLKSSNRFFSDTMTYSLPLLIAFDSLVTLFRVVERDALTLTLLSSPIFPSSSPHQQYSGLSFLAALTKKLRIVFSEFHTNLPTDPSHLPKYIQITKDYPFRISYSLDFCYYSFFLPILLLKATPPIEVHSEIIQELILFVKEALTTILTNISNIDILIASLPSDSSPLTPCITGVDTQMIEALKELRFEFDVFVHAGWSFFVGVTFEITKPHKSLFQTIILDDPSFPDLILNTLKLTHQDIGTNSLITVSNIVHSFPSMKDNFISVDLVGRIFETVDFLSLSLSESKPVYQLTKFIEYMLYPNGDDDEAKFEQYRLIRVTVFEPAKQFVTFMFRNSDKLILDETRKPSLEIQLAIIHNHIKNMELRSDEHDTDFVSEIAKWEVRTMVEMENKVAFNFFFENLLNRTYEWRWNQPERQKRREVNVTFSPLSLHSIHLVHVSGNSHLLLLICHSKDVLADRNDTELMDNAVLEMEGDEERDSVELE
ncbi:hypothetical protein BLNAU_11483 [Blattamonas nauphoetae]|uniref:FPL domain-containing protein n=1 Tax=Blattamonas nauphoetae TaxID=2049346 RepID=A0ABQ9XRN8_9EUKA|nr:hypothetical protein BLNAU_11483 [Blattamonas nauphoetae]